MARKGWDRLNPDYRARLQKGGVTKSKYERGEQLHKARGHISRQHEVRQQTFYRLVDRRDFDRDTARDVVESIGFDDALAMLEAQEMALSGDDFERELGAGAMRIFWAEYHDDDDIPDEWFYYHG